MAPRLTLLSTCLFMCYYMNGSGAIITNGNNAEGNIQGNKHRHAHFISITEQPPKQNPTRHAESKVDALGESQFHRGQSLESKSLYSSSSQNYPEYHHSGLSYSEGYDFGGLTGHSSSGENSLESSIASSGIFGDFKHNHYMPHHHMNREKHHNHKSVALKGLLVPLAGVALLGAAAALVSNPILLQLGVITGKKRRRRDTDADFPHVPNLSAAEAEAVQQKLKEIALLERFMTQVPKEQAVSQEKQLLANYLSCSGSTNANTTSGSCVERLTCELHHPDSDASQLEKHVMSIITSEILTNEYVPDSVKERVKSATTTGSQSGNCSEFPCDNIERN